MGVPDAERLAGAYAERKQARLEALIEEGGVSAFADALRFVKAVSALGWPVAVASSSKNANAMLSKVRLGDDGRCLLEVFGANVCGRNLAHGKPAPDIFLLAASELLVPPARCFVAEDAPAGIQAARAGGMAGLGGASVVRKSGVRAQLPQPRLGSGGADIVRASQLQHTVERVDSHLHLGRATLVRMRAQSLILQ